MASSCDDIRLCESLLSVVWVVGCAGIERMLQGVAGHTGDSAETETREGLHSPELSIRPCYDADEHHPIPLLLRPKDVTVPFEQPIAELALRMFGYDNLLTLFMFTSAAFVVLGLACVGSGVALIVRADNGTDGWAYAKLRPLQP